MWHKAFLGTGLDPAEVSQEIRESFGMAFMAAGRPSGMAMFARHALMPSGKVGVTVFFPPGAVAFAGTRLGTSPCMEPNKSTLKLLVGNADAWRACFPEN